MDTVRIGQDVVIRRAVEDDLPSIVALLADDELGAQRESPHDLAPYRRAFAVIDADPHQLLVVAESDGVVVATLQLSRLAGLSRRGSTRAQIEGLRVAGSRRGQALGQALMKWALEQARSWGCHLVQLTSDKSRPDAHRFYDWLGFVASHEGYKLQLDAPPSGGQDLQVGEPAGGAQDLLSRHGTGQQIPLGQVATEQAQQVQGLDGLDPLGDRTQAQLPHEPQR